MRPSRLGLLLVLGAAVAALPVPDVLDARQPADPPARKPRKVALLVGPGAYLHDFGKLDYTARDVEALAAVLRDTGFDEVVVLTDPPEGKNPATRQNVLTQIEKLVAKQPVAANNVRQGDVVLVLLSGHGQELDVPDPEKPGKTKREAFFAPTDGKKGKPDTLVSLGHVVNDVLAPCGGRNLLLVDACREVYDPNKGKGIGGRSVSLSGQSAVLFSCSTGELSYESADVKHGVFTHTVLEVIRESKAAGKPLSWSGLVSKVEEKMGEDAVKKLLPTGQTQTPVLAAGQVPPTELFSVRSVVGEPKAGEERTFEIAAGVKMVFCFIPPGEVRLGSQKAERDAVLKQLGEEKEPDWLASEAEGVRGKYTSKGFWLGKYPVTQGEWKAVMGKNPSYFSADGDGKDKVKGTDTSRFPVEQVSWDDCQKFLEAVNARGGVVKVFGKAGQLRLPHEDEWEYAYRGASAKKQAYYWGDQLNGTEANCDGNYPFGTTTKGAYLERTCEVEFTNGGRYPEHPWKLMHMSGNVLQWCDNKYSNDRRVLRGGSCHDFARSCRAARRNYGAPDIRFNSIGFRVCLPLD